MNYSADLKPSSLSLIGWFLVMVAALTILSSAASLLKMNYSSTKSVEIRKPFGKSTLVGRKINFSFMLQSHVTPLNIFNILFGITLLIGSINFLKLKSWARLMIEILAWIFLTEMFVLFVSVKVFGIQEIYLVPQFFEDQGANSGVKTMVTVIFVVSGIAYVVITGFVLKHLRGDTIRSWMKSPTEPIVKIEQS